MDRPAGALSRTPASLRRARHALAGDPFERDGLGRCGHERRHVLGPLGNGRTGPGRLPLLLARPDLDQVDGVRLGIADPAGLAAAYAACFARLGPRVTVTDMAAPGWELILGMARDPALGPLIVVGAGGVLTEHLAERAVALPPLTSQAASTLLNGLRFSGILQGVRGQPPCDRDAITSAITAFSTLVSDLGDQLAAFDINPLICSPTGVVAVDALAIPAR